MSRCITAGMVPGMAWLSGTGPANTTCGDCIHVLERRKSGVTCGQSKRLATGRVVFPGNTPSCRRFEFDLGVRRNGAP